MSPRPAQARAARGIPRPPFRRALPPPGRAVAARLLLLLLPLLPLQLPPLPSSLAGAAPAAALPAEERAREMVGFVRNTYRSVLRRDPTTEEFDRWLKFLEGGGEKAKMTRDLRDTDEYLRANKPAGLCARLSVTVHARPEATSLRAGALMPGDRFQVVGREGEFYRVVGPASGWVERDAIDLAFATQKIGESEAPEQAASAEAELDKLAADLTHARGQMLDCLVMDGRSTLYQMKPGLGVAGEKARERYQELLNRLAVALKVRAADDPFEFRGALLDLRDADLYKYELLGRLDRIQRLGANTIVLRFFDRGVTPAALEGYPRTTRAPWKTLEERLHEELKRRGLALCAWTSGFDFGPAFARESPDRLAMNGLGFTSERYLPGSAYADPLLAENREHLRSILAAAAPGPPVTGLFIDGLFPPETPDLPRDLRALFGFNPSTVKAFQSDTGLRLAAVSAAQEKIFLGWLRNGLREAYAEIRREADARGAKLAVVVPGRALAQADLRPVTYRDVAADYFVVAPADVERFGFAVPGRVIVRYDRAATAGGIERVDRECRAFRAAHPRVAGWLVEP